MTCKASEPRKKPHRGIPPRAARKKTHRVYPRWTGFRAAASTWRDVEANIDAAMLRLPSSAVLQEEISMKRLTLCALALVLTSGALVVGGKPAGACIINPPCVSHGCASACPDGGGVCNTCTGRCLCLA